MRKKFAALMLTGAIALAPMQPAYALFGVGDVVIDPTNLAQNILTAARTLEMINNQITQLQNEAQMLINQGRNLANLPHSSLARLRSIMQQTEDLLGEAQRVGDAEGEVLLGSEEVRGIRVELVGPDVLARAGIEQTEGRTAARAEQLDGSTRDAGCLDGVGEQGEAGQIRK